MSAELEKRLQEALDAQALSDELRREVAGKPELESMIAQDAALRAMPRTEVDFSEAVLGRLDEALDDIPGLFDAPSFESDVGPGVSSDAANASAPEASPPPPPMSLDEARRKRSAAPFLLSAAAVIGLVATGTLMTLNAPASEQVAMEAARPAPSSVSPQDYAEQSTRGSLASSAEEESAPEEMAEEPSAAAPAAPTVASGAAEADFAEADSDFAEAASAEPRAQFGGGALAEFDSEERSESPARTARSVARPSANSARGAADPLDDSLARDSLSPSQRRTVARIESCLPDHIRITRVRQSSDGQRVVGVETSEPLSDEVDECVSGVVDTFPRARRRRRSATMRTPPTTTAIDDL